MPLGGLHLRITVFGFIMFCGQPEMLVCVWTDLQEQLYRSQAALEQWKLNDSVQLEAARNDISRLKQQLEAHTESAKVASAQCKSAQAELKSARQQMAAQYETSRSAQAELESMRQQLTAQRETSQSAQAEVASMSQSCTTQHETAQGELASAREELAAQMASSREQQHQMQLKIAELEAQHGQQAEQLRRIQEEAQIITQDNRQLQVGINPPLSLLHSTCKW